MRPVRYRVAASLDGFIAGPNGEIDWIIPNPSVDFTSIYAGVDTVLLGRRTYELTLQPGAPPWPPGWRIYVFSNTLDARAHRGVTVVGKDATATVAALRSEDGGDIWLFGGGSLFASLLAANLVDKLEIAVIPVILGAGVPLVSPVAAPIPLTLTHSAASPNGIVSLTYDVSQAPG